MNFSDIVSKDAILIPTEKQAPSFRKSNTSELPQASGFRSSTTEYPSKCHYSHVPKEDYHPPETPCTSDKDDPTAVHGLFDSTLIEVQHSPVRVLLCGDVGGRLHHFANSIENANKNHGPFSFVLCCGGFFADSGTRLLCDAEYRFSEDGRSVSVTVEEYEYLSGQASFCIPVYFIDSSHSYIGMELRLHHSEKHKFTSSLTYLGNLGFTNLCGITVGFLSGLYDATRFFMELTYDSSEQDYTSLQRADELPTAASTLSVYSESTAPRSFPSTSSSSTFAGGCNDFSSYESTEQVDFLGDFALYYSSVTLRKFKRMCSLFTAKCDIFLSCEWPAGIEQGLPPSQKNDLQSFLELRHLSTSVGTSTEKTYGVDSLYSLNSVGVSRSPVLSDIGELLEPRYHIAGGMNVFYQRPPFKTVNSGIVCKFIGLSSVTSLPDASTPCKAFKFLHALILKPVTQLGAEALHSEPPDCTPSPYFFLYDAKKKQQALQARSETRAAVGVLDHRDLKNQEDGYIQNHRCSSRETLSPGDGLPLKRQCVEDSHAPSVESPDPHLRCLKPSCCVFISNIPYEVDPGSFMEIMESFGQVVQATIPRTSNGKSNGKAWITYSTQQEAEKAVAAHEQLQSGGRLLKIQFSNAKNSGTFGGRTWSTGNVRYPDGDKRQASTKNRLSGTGVGQTPQAIDVRPHTGCWFCLANPNSEKRLIISLGERVYIALAKGGLVPYHVLVIPVTHFPNYIFCPPNVSIEIEAYIHALRNCFRTQHQDIIVYERYFPMKMTTGMHMQLQVIPIPQSLSAASAKAFYKRAKRAGINLQHLNKTETLKDLGQYVKDSVVHPYFYVELPGQHADTIERYVYHSLSSNQDEGRLPFNFGREAAADLLEKPERSNWKCCVEETSVENEYSQYLQKLFTPFQPKGS